ncbi:hypothetical protein HGB24_03795 [Candidatus Saccharibacteria bacterium]|nr:hypothetical protein [Candidatus Saccharibacteria bacterium]
MDLVYYASDGLVFFGLIVLSLLGLVHRGYKIRLNRLFSFFSFSLATWLVSSDLLNFTSVISPSVASMLDHLLYASALAAVMFLTLFVLELSGDKKVYQKIVKYSMWPMMVVLIMSGVTNLIDAGVDIQNGIYMDMYGPYIWLFVASLFYMTALMLVGIFMGVLRSTGYKKSQIKITGIGLMVAVPSVIFFAMLMPLVTGQESWSFVSSMPILILIVTLYYSVVRYHLFDIRLAAVRTLAYSMSLGLLVGVYYGLAIILTGLFKFQGAIISENPLNVLVMFVLILVFQPVKKFFDRFTNQVFYRDYYDSDAFLDELNRVLTTTNNLRSMLERAAKKISGTLKCEQAFFFVQSHNGHFLTAGTANHTIFNRDDIMTLRAAIKHNQTTRHNTDTATMGSKIEIASLLPAGNPLRLFMQHHKLEIILPLYHQGMLGYLFLGEHRTSHYTSRDIKVLSVIDDSLAIAVQNALSVESIRESNIELRQIDKIKDEFVSIASHELRTPMTVIRGFVNLLQREQLGGLNDGQQEILAKINDNTKTLINLVNDMLDISKLEANKMDITIGRHNLLDLTDASIDKIRLMFDKKGITLKNTVKDVVVKTDPNGFDRIMTNLLGNAYKFTNSGGKVEVSSSVDKHTGMVTICVSDTGVGIPESAMGKLFKKFSQINNYLQRQVGGTGLGLSICKQMVERLGGTIWVESKVGVGSKFYFTIPIKRDNEN